MRLSERDILNLANTHVALGDNVEGADYQSSSINPGSTFRRR
jgi:hypothetical protein